MSRTRAETFSHTVCSEEAGERLDKLLGEMEQITSRSMAQRLIEGGHVRVNGMPATKRHLTRSGERIDVVVPPPEPSDLEAELIPLDVRFEDDHMIVLSKPAGMVVHPAHGHWSGTLVNALLAHSQELGGLSGEDRPGIVHRLDKDTTGLMMVAKDDETQAALSEAIKLRSVDRRYLTLVHGYIAPDSGLVDAPIGRSRKDPMKMAITDAAGSRQAVTTFKVLERFMAGTHDDGYTLVECKLYTGRTHQIRVHMLYIDHAVVGDQLYGPRRPRADMYLERQFLHSYRISFEHPATGEHIDLTDPLPEDLAKRLASLDDRSMGRTAAGEQVFEHLAQAAAEEA